MLQETIDSLDVQPGGTYLDATLGGGGHAAEIMRRAGPDVRLLGIDRDAEAITRATKYLSQFPGSVTYAQGNHADLGQLADAHGFHALDGVVIDTGVSSFQLDSAERGFSFMQDGPLDMRMDQRQELTAATIINRYSVDELIELFRRLGEEPQARRIATAIARAREDEAITTTGQLANLVQATIGRRQGLRHHPATRIFQALRMEVNGELEALRHALDAAMERLAPGGRLAVLTFESLSDRIVNRCMGRHVGRYASLYQGGSQWDGLEPRMAWVFRRSLRPTLEECSFNPRARSARLRAVQRFQEEETPYYGRGESTW